MFEIHFYIASWQVAMLETSSLSILFLTDSPLSSGIGVKSLALGTIPNIQNNSLNQSENEISNASMKEVAFVLTTDGHFFLVESTTSKMICQPLSPKEGSTAISLWILGKSMVLTLYRFYVGVLCCNLNRLFLIRGKCICCWRIWRGLSSIFWEC